ncbi:MAG: sugar phosphate isomerase/epimerase [Acidimicrobiales bacterium]|nr:sugar phosphate isomerase/epimerase [Acidimicrobiales bacterium]
MPTAEQPQIYLGTVAIEPNRWGMAQPGGGATIKLSDWIPAIAEAGFDGIELWERHYHDADAAERARLATAAVPIRVFNTYASWDEPEPDFRDLAAKTAADLGAFGVKFNVGNDPEQQAAYVDRLAAFVERLPADAAALCECHHGISIAEDPAVAAAIFDAVGSPRVQAMVHTHEDPDHLRARFDAYGDRITHVHVNFLDFESGGAPVLAEACDRLAGQITLLRSLGFAGSWTIEFVHGLMTEGDQPQLLVEQAIADLAVLREVLA